MPRSATVNYHIPSDQEQAYHIDAGGERGRILGPDLAVTEVSVHDLRGVTTQASFRADSVGFAKQPTSVANFEDGDGWHETYDRELADLLSRELGATEVIVFDHTLRIDDPTSGRKPARNVHSDYSADGAHQRLRDILGEETAQAWEHGHFGFVNVWRPVGAPINSAPLGFVRPSTVRPEDWIQIKLIYPDRIGQIMGLVARDSHEWLYLSRMAPDEVAIFNIYDNRGLPSVAHSAMDMVEDPDVTVPRKSVESRTLVRY